MKRLLILSYDFPPSLTGVRRILKWLKYLPDFGWEGFVLTVKDIRYTNYDATGLAWVKRNRIQVHRSGSLDPYRLAQILSPRHKKREGTMRHSSKGAKSFMKLLRDWLFIPDDRCGWIPFASLKGRRLIRKHRPDAILTTSYPNSAHVAGLILKKWTGIPWAADFRDAWTQNPIFFHPPTPLHRLLQKRLEKAVIHNADLILTVSEPITDHFRRLAPSKKGKIVTLTNGYDEGDFTNLESHHTKKFTLVYTGTLYGPATPKPLFLALKEILKEHPSWRGTIEILFYSALEDTILKSIRKLGIEDVVHVKGLCPYEESLQHQMDASALLLFLASGQNAEVTVTQKVFEYLRSGRPILAMIPEGACRNLLEKFNEPYISDPGDVRGIKINLKKMYEEWERGALSAAERKGIEVFDRRNLTGRLVSLLESTCLKGGLSTES